MSIKISAIICTHNRAEYLLKAIQSLVDQTLDKTKYEIIVVDNKSTDNTKNIALDNFSTVSNLKYLYEPVLGLSQARNTGLNRANGKYVAYLDDDAIANPRWLENILEVFEKATPQPGIVSGRVKPIWERSRPVWLPDKLLGSLTIVDWSKQAIFLNKEQWPAGANIAFPKNLLEKVGGFDTALGRKGNKLLSMEEIDVRQKIEDKGYKCYYSPDIVVSHHIPALRLTKRWFVRRWYWQGFSIAVNQICRESLSFLMRIKKALSVLKTEVRSPHRLKNVILPTNDPELFGLKCLSIMSYGFIIGQLNPFQKYDTKK